MVKILGLNSFHPNSSSCLVQDGIIKFCIEEERINRIKNWSGFPEKSIEMCLSETNTKINEIDFIAINSNPHNYLLEKAKFLINNFYSINFFWDRFTNYKKKKNFFYKNINIKYVDHHISHIASSVLTSGFHNASCLSLDGFGDFCSAVLAKFVDGNINVEKRIFFPHSLGIFYHAFTQFLGFKNYGDEYKVMGLAAYGKPKYKEVLKNIIKYDENNFYTLNLKYFNFFKKNLIESNNNSPIYNDLFSNKIFDILGKSRSPEEKIEEKHVDLAASIQDVYEEIFFKLLNKIFKIQNNSQLSLSGGCIMNSVANGKITENTPFKKIYIPFSPGDNGGAIGAALYTSSKILNKEIFVNNHLINSSPYMGKMYKNSEIFSILEKNKKIKEIANVNYYDDDNILINKTAQYIAQKKIVGWFQNQIEFGSRALGNRSILADPRDEKIRDKINSQIKIREMFRPFAPSILKEYVSEYFEQNYESKYMSYVFKVKKNKIKEIPAVTHVDGTGRLQTVTEISNIKFYKLISQFKLITGIPILLNTSLNENEPIVMSPEDALNMFMRTKLDILVMQNYLILRK